MFSLRHRPEPQPDDDCATVPVYEITADSLRPPWVSRAFLKYTRAQRLVPRYRILPMLCAAAATALMHALLIAGALRYQSARSAIIPEENSGAGSIAIVSDQVPVMTLILIDEPQPMQQEADIPASELLASRGFAPDDLIKLLSPDGEPAFDTSAANTRSSPPTAATLDSAQRAMLFGRYVGQVDARIERGWLKPRSAIGASQFKCQVMIKQDHDGNVMETTLQVCNGDLRWQLSLVHAIQSASPLPSPPDERVFADALTLTFSALPYRPGMSAEDYEPETPDHILASKVLILNDDTRPAATAVPTNGN